MTPSLPRSHRGAPACAITAFCVCTGTAALASPSAASWQQSRYDAHNAAAVELGTVDNATARTWSFDGSGRVWGYEPGMTIWSSPTAAVVAGRAVVAVGSYDRNVYCLDAATGELVWKHTTGGGVYAAPTVWNDGERDILFAAATDRLVYALDASTGRQVWVHSVETYRPTLGGAQLSSPVVGEAAGRPAVFVGYWVADATLLNNMQRGAMIALDARTGRPIWDVDLGDNQITAPIFARRGERQRAGTATAWLFAGSYSGTVFALDADTGTVLWRKPEHDAVRSPPALAVTPGGPIVITASKFGAVRGLAAASGEELWSYKTGDRITGSPAIYAHDGRLRTVVGSYDRSLYAFDVQSGELLWRYQARGGIYSSPAVVERASQSLVLVSAWDHSLHAVDADDGATRYVLYTGRPLWGVSGMDDSNWASPTAARMNGTWMVFAGSYDGSLRGFLLDEAVHGAGPPRSNIAFWISFPVVLFPVGLLAVFLTRRERRQRAAKTAPPRCR